MVRWSLTFFVERPAVIRSRWILFDDMEEGTAASQRLARGQSSDQLSGKLIEHPHSKTTTPL